MHTTPPHLICTAQRPPAATPFDPKWRTETAMALGRGIVANWAFDRMLVLADVLEEAGCDDPVVLRHCRECHHHTARCWVLGDLFARPPVARAVALSDAEVRRELERVTGRYVEPAGDGFPNRSALAWKLVPAAFVVGIALSVKTCVTVNPYRPPYIPPQSFQQTGITTPPPPGHINVRR